MFFLAADRLGVVVDGGEGHLQFAGDGSPGEAGGAEGADGGSCTGGWGVGGDAVFALEGGAVFDLMRFVDFARVGVDDAEGDVQFLDDRLVAAALEEKLLDSEAAVLGVFFLRHRLGMRGFELLGEGVAIGDAVLSE